ncbi:endonuclease/exonuclease/phosphatase family protein [Actinomadura sp. BRA 177]|uniref:endonuclease/exonuclease/phosphatase family protein n=1 Tax=Actinomadura sp. BRA 177 TaxID=2745202 RepID=UPI0015961EFC|nr:endonuclease/exonuclease/phosphatase family protein [Actinomadura sp. BRA 177]NVI86680.1 endonuclease/exonuclease/phosphatase family protein [Actinomadura sp. BRA 177]
MSRIRWDVLLGVVVLADVLHVFLPSLITLVGSAGSTPAEVMGGYALSWFVAAFLTVPLARFAPAARLAVAGGVLLVAARIVLQLTDGGDPQLYASSIGLLGGLVWLTATAMTVRDAAPAMTGFVAGLAAATALHAAIEGIDLVWRTGLVPWLPLAVYLALFAITLTRRPEGSETPAAPRIWFAAGPAFPLWGIWTGNAAHAQASAGWSGGVAAAVVTAAAALSVAAAARPRFWTRHPLVPAAGLVLSAAGFAAGRATVDGVHGVSPSWTVAAQVLGQFALAGCLGWAASVPGPDRPGRRGTAMAGGWLLFVVLMFAYYSAYDLGTPNRWVPVVTALGVAALIVRAPAPRREHSLEVWAAAAAVVAVLAVAAIPLWRDTGPRWRPVDDGGLRIAAYNVRMGYGLDGTMTVTQQADVLRAMRPHIVVLGEVDRAWLLNGGRDSLRLMSERLGMRAIWAPAADEVWGDALLTDLPVTSVRNKPLMKGGPTGAQALAVGLRWKDRDVTVIATHTQPPADWSDLGQAEQLADLASAAARDGRQVVLAGDLNLEPGSRPWHTLMDAGLTDALAASRPFATPVTGSKPIDHVLVTPGLTGRDAANKDVPYSDHPAIAVTLTAR